MPLLFAISIMAYFFNESKLRFILGLKLKQSYLFIRQGGKSFIAQFFCYLSNEKIFILTRSGVPLSRSLISNGSSFSDLFTIFSVYGDR
jgi:hypothetical protein